MQIFWIFLRLGLTSFGGPIAHLGYFRREFVERLKWLSEKAYDDLVALCQFLPGPASSQVGMGIGLSRAGIRGAIAAWLGFTLPSAVLMILFGLNLPYMENTWGTGWLHGLKIVAVAIVAQALWNMRKTCCPDLFRLALASLSTGIVIFFPNTMGQIGSMVLGGLLGYFFIQIPNTSSGQNPKQTSYKHSYFPFLLTFALLLLLLTIATKSSHYVLQLFSCFYCVGSLVFGGGHVVLPLLQAVVVPQGWVSNETFLAGYGLAQSLPGPLFTFAAYLGSISTQMPAGWLGGTIALIAIFLPSFLLVSGTLPLWEQWSHIASVRKSMNGVNATVVGILFAAFCNPIWTTTIHNRLDLAFTIITFLMLTVWQIPSWLVVALTALAAKMVF